MEYWTEEKLRIERNKDKEEICRIKREISDLAVLLAYHMGRLEYLEGISSNQTKINFDENDTNQY